MKTINNIISILAVAVILIGCSKDNSEPIIETPEPTQIITVSTIAGNGDVGANNGSANEATFNLPRGIVRDAAGNTYIADSYNHRIRKITPEGMVSTFAGSDEGFAEGTLSEAQFRRPWGLAIDGNGNMYVADTGNNRIRIITPDGNVSTLAGSSYGDEDGLGANANFGAPRGLTIDDQGNLYICDTGNSKIKKVTAFGLVTTIAGSEYGFADGIGNQAKLNYPYDIAINTDGNMYIADTDNHRIRKVTPDGIVTTLTGSTEGGTNGTLSEALFNYPTAIASDDSGNLYVVGENYQIRKISSDGIVSTIAGSTSGYDDGDANVAKFEILYGICIDDSNNFLVTDALNSRIRKITIEESN